jgi:RHS repeat-associated protein
VTESRSYNAANQVVGWSYDQVGNLLSDGSSSYTYDALNRMTTATQGSQTRSNTYNGDGVLVAQNANGLTTSYVQDLASPLSQVLQTSQNGSTSSYLYGLERLAAVSGTTRAWYNGDALASVRMTLSDTGMPLSAVNYDPWGTPESGTVPTFGFTGELQDTTTGLVNLRARWYHTGHGTFTAFRWRTDESFDETPYSHHPYIYALSNPTLYMDPDGRYARLGGQGGVDEVLEGLCPPGTSFDWALYEKHGIINCIPKPPPPNNEQTSRRRNGQERIEDVLRESNTQALNPPISGPWPGERGRTGGLSDRLKACLLVGLLTVPLAAAITDVSQPDRSNQGKHYVQADGITIKVGFDPRNAHKAVKLGYDENLREPIPEGYSINEGWFWSGLASKEDQQQGWWPELMDAMANTSRINFVVDGMDVVNNPNRLKADKITHREMDEIIRRGYIGKLHLWENDQEITGQRRLAWIGAWIQLRGL